MKVEVQKGDRPPIIDPTYARVLGNLVFARILPYIKSALHRNDISGGDGSAVSLQLIAAQETALPSPRLSPDGAAGIDITTSKTRKNPVFLVQLEKYRNFQDRSQVKLRINKIHFDLMPTVLQV